MPRLVCAFMALFFCMAPANAQTCVSIDSLLEKIEAARRDHRVVEPGPVLEHLLSVFAQTPPPGPPPAATRAIVIDLPSGIIVVYIVQDMACSPLVIAESPFAREIRALVFGERI